MFSRLGLNRSPQHHQHQQPQQSLPQSPLAFNKKKVLLPASVFNKLDKDRSVSRQPKPKHDKSLTPNSHKLQVALQPSKSRALLVQKSKDQSSWLSKSNLKKHCQNCNSFMGNQDTESQLSLLKNRSLKEQMKSVKDIHKRNQINNLYQTIFQKSKQIDEKKDHYQIQQMRVVENFKRQKQKINQFYTKISNVLLRHKEATLAVVQKKQEEIIGQLQSKMKAMTNKIQSLSLLEDKVAYIIPGIQKLSAQLFDQTLNSVKNQYIKLISHFNTPSINIKPITVKIGDEKYLSKQLVETIEHFLHINNLSIKKNQFKQEKIITNNSMSISGIQDLNTSLNSPRSKSKSKVSFQENCLEKYISVVDAEESESDCEMLLSKRL